MKVRLPHHLRRGALWMASDPLYRDFGMGVLNDPNVRAWQIYGRKNNYRRSR